MTEKINGQGFRATDIASTRRSESSKPASGDAARGASAPAGDTVNLTASGLLLSKLEEVLQNVPVVDADRVRSIKDALASGTYEIDAQRVADRLLRLDRELAAG